MDSFKDISPMHRDVWVFVEERGRRIHPVTFELLTKGRSLAHALAERLVAVMFGSPLSDEKRTLERYGADEILSLTVSEEQKNSHELMAGLLSMAIEEMKPSILLAGATSLGRTLMPLIAVEARTGLTADCTGLEIDRERRILLQTRPAFGGNIMATIECPYTRPQMATVRPHVLKKEETKQRKSAVLTQKSYSFSLSPVVEILETIIEEEGRDISEADVIVAGGRGLGKAEGFGLLEKLASRLGGMVGASRGAVDMGWIQSAYQVGQTGHTVSPRLYIACGISGAVQHVAGIKGAETVIAINEDKEAPLFEVADFGIVGDLYEVIPSLLEEIDKGETL